MKCISREVIFPRDAIVIVSLIRSSIKCASQKNHRTFELIKEIIISDEELWIEKLIVNLNASVIKKQKPGRQISDENSRSQSGVKKFL